MREDHIRSLPADPTLLSPSESDSWLITAAVRHGYLIRPAPRVVMSAAMSDNPAALIRAVHTWNPDAVVTGRSALLALKGAPATCPIHVISPDPLRDRPNIRFLRTRLPSELIIATDAGAFSNIEVAVLVCAAMGDLKTACLALRKGWMSLGTLSEASELLRPNSWLGRTATRVLRDLAGNPWSMAELELHRILRSAGITGWVGNPTVQLNGTGPFDPRGPFNPTGPFNSTGQLTGLSSRHPDVAFPKRRLGIEVDSVEFHSGAQALEEGTRRTAEFLLEGWQVVAVTPSMVRESPSQVLDLIRSQLAVTPLRGKPTR